MTNGPQTSPGDTSPSWSPQRDVTESAQYDRLLETNPAFRDSRIRRECGPITDPTSELVARRGLAITNSRCWGDRLWLLSRIRAK